VVKVAHRFRQPTRLPLDDLVQEGNLGLLHAIDLYDPERETRFSTYAVWWIFHRMTRALTDCGRLVRIPSHIQAAFYRVRKKRAQLREDTGHEPSAAEAATEAGVSPAKLAEAERLMSAAVVDVDASPDADRAPAAGVHADELVLDPATVVDVHCGFERLKAELERLPTRQRDVLTRRFGLRDGEPATLREIAEDYGISGERVRQIQGAGLRRLRARIQEGPLAA
jgi:RNA polymerase primary sigma factor